MTSNFGGSKGYILNDVHLESDNWKKKKNTQKRPQLAILQPVTVLTTMLWIQGPFNSMAKVQPSEKFNKWEVGNSYECPMNACNFWNDVPWSTDKRHGPPQTKQEEKEMKERRLIILGTNLDKS